MCRIFLLSVLFLIALATIARAQSTAFTYQGRLNDAGSPATGVHDFRFRLFDAASAGTQLGNATCVDNLTVTDGVFTATLDFGARFASGTPRFLEISVRRDTGLTCANDTGFQTLTPRQPVSPTPQAQHAASAFSLAAPDGTPAVRVDAAGQVTIGAATPRAKFHIDSGDLYAGLPGNGWFVHTRSTFNGDFMHITDTTAGIPQFQHGLVLTKAGNVGIGTTAPRDALEVFGDVRLGATGSVFAVGSNSRARAIYGIVYSNGAASGSGFTTAAHPEPGHVVITLTDTINPAFAMVITPYDAPRALAHYVRRIDNRTIDVYTYNFAGAAVDLSFSFVGFGPRIE